MRHFFALMVAVLSWTATFAQRIYVGVDVFHKREQRLFNDVGGYILKPDYPSVFASLSYGINFGYQVLPKLTLETGLYRNTLISRTNFVGTVPSFSNAQGAFQLPLRVKLLLLSWGNRERNRLEAFSGTTVLTSEYDDYLLKRSFWSAELGASFSRELGKRQRMMFTAAYTYQWGLSGTVKRTDVRYTVGGRDYQATVNANGGGHFYTIGLKYLIRRQKRSADAPYAPDTK